MKEKSSKQTKKITSKKTRSGMVTKPKTVKQDEVLVKLIFGSQRVRPLFAQLMSLRSKTGNFVISARDDKPLFDLIREYDYSSQEAFINQLAEGIATKRDVSLVVLARAIATRYPEFAAELRESCEDIILDYVDEMKSKFYSGEDKRGMTDMEFIRWIKKAPTSSMPDSYFWEKALYYFPGYKLTSEVKYEKDE